MADATVPPSRIIAVPPGEALKDDPLPTADFRNWSNARATLLLSQAVNRHRPENTPRESQGSKSDSRVTQADTLRHATGSQPDHEPLHPYKSVRFNLESGCPMMLVTKSRG
jgi:hypothetical protein